ncbi:hypothetical protein GBA52_024753 [Prunus armeniaca]|nr:hypothetical protein GBA52_024753 [Prunus armeniaca]
MAKVTAAIITTTNTPTIIVVTITQPPFPPPPHLNYCYHSHLTTTLSIATAPSISHMMTPPQSHKC